MRSHLKLLLVVGLMVLMMPLLLGYLAGPSGASHPNIIGQHQKSYNVTNGTCNGCHDMMASNESQNPLYLAAHRRHFLSAFLNFVEDTSTAGFGCGDCHEETVYGGDIYYEGMSYEGLGSGLEGDLSYNDTNTPVGAPISKDSTRVARKQVKPDVCESCHGKFTGSTADSTLHGDVDYATTDPGGCLNGTCHTGGGTGKTVAVGHAGKSYINTRYAQATNFCTRCHGGLAWYQTEETSHTLP